MILHKYRCDRNDHNYFCFGQVRLHADNDSRACNCFFDIFYAASFQLQCSSVWVVDDVSLDCLLGSRLSNSSRSRRRRRDSLTTPTPLQILCIDQHAPSWWSFSRVEWERIACMMSLRIELFAIYSQATLHHPQSEIRKENVLNQLPKGQAK